MEKKIYTCGKCGSKLTGKRDNQCSYEIYHHYCDNCKYQFSIYGKDGSILFYITPDDVEKDFSVNHIRPLNLPELHISAKSTYHKDIKLNFKIQNCKIITDMSYEEFKKKLLDGIFVVVRNGEVKDVGYVEPGG